MRILKQLISVVGVFFLSGCCWNAYTNKAMDQTMHRVSEEATHATFDIKDKRGNPDVLLAMALSGGGSRAAYFSASAMLKLQDVFNDIDILKEIDVVSSVSGGSLPAAYYCISKDSKEDKVRSNRYWNEGVVKKLMSINYQGKWIENLFWPYNIFRYWFTAYDRSDIMAQTFEDNLFDVSPLGSELKFRDLNPERPYLIINATDGTENIGKEKHFGELFTFTKEDFSNKLNSDINSYSVARAVMASAAFPGAFNYMTLMDYRDPEVKDERYLHLFDGGNSDNLGLKSIKRILFATKDRYKHYIVILIDSYKEKRGIDRNNCDPRSLFSYVVDLNFMDTFDSLLDANRKNLLDQFKSHTFNMGDNKTYTIGNLTFWHVTFQDIDPGIKDDIGTEEKSFKEALNMIPTSFSIDAKDTKRIDRAVDLLINEDNVILKQIRDLLLGKHGRYR